MNDSPFTVDIGRSEGFRSGSDPKAVLNRMAQQVVMEWYQAMLLEGRGYQVRAGTITTPLVGDVVITDTAAELCVDAALGLTILPVYQSIVVRLGTGTLHEYATKSVAGASSAGAAFVPLPLKPDGVPATLTARVAAAGGVTVPAELATTTRRHWAASNPVAVGAGHDKTDFEWEPALKGSPPLVAGASGIVLYTQIAATGTGPSYYASLDVLELPTALIN